MRTEGHWNLLGTGSLLTKSIVILKLSGEGLLTTAIAFNMKGATWTMVTFQTNQITFFTVTLTLMQTVTHAHTIQVTNMFTYLHIYNKSS